MINPLYKFIMESLYITNDKWTVDAFYFMDNLHLVRDIFSKLYILLT